jgi:hypothetical protein
MADYHSVKLDNAEIRSCPLMALGSGLRVPIMLVTFAALQVPVGRKLVRFTPGLRQL